MSYIGRLIFLCGFIIFTSLSKVSVNGSALVPSLKKLYIDNDSSLNVESLMADQILDLDYRHNDISFEFTDGDSIEYQYFLQNFDKGWSSWKRNNFKEYTNLPAKNYILEVRYRIYGAGQSEMTPLKIRILPMWYISNVAVLIYFILFVLMVWAIYSQLDLRYARRQYMLEQIINNRTEDLIVEKEKTEALLANLLPKNTAAEIMSKGKATKIKYNFVTVLFSDIQGFTKIAEEMNPEVLIDELDKFFFHFDSVVEKYGIEKIKTIGDAYMCAGGIPEKNRTNPVEIILAALEMRVYMDKLKETSETEGMRFWDIRIGIHTGTVVAGVVGHKKLSYDIWGDTVNTASRMESSGEAGKINISGTTYEFVKEFFACEYRGKMPVKYKGELEMYFVTGIVPELKDENGGPNNKFLIKIQKIKLQDIEDVIIKLFDDEAPPNLYFHNSLMVKSISNQVEILATAENLPDEDFVNIKLASVFLLTGFITDYEKPMEASFRLAEEILPRYGFSQENVEITKRLIKNSFEDQMESPSDSILHDSRYDYLGRIDFMKLTEKLLRERTEYGKHSDNLSWTEIQTAFLDEHDFRTNTGNILRSVQISEQKESLMSIRE